MNGVVSKCAECARGIRHDRCPGRRFCCCLVCHKQAIMADAADRAAAGDRLMAEMVFLNTQRVYIATKARTAPSRYFGGCHCGCGEQVYGPAWGAPRRYVDATHKRRAAYRRARLRQAA